MAQTIYVAAISCIMYNWKRIPLALIVWELYAISLCIRFFFPVRNLLDKIGPEVEALLRLLIWNFTLRRKRTSLGKQ